MSYSKVKIPSEVYHLTKRKNAEQILKDGKVMRFGDSECWFCRSILCSGEWAGRALWPNRSKS